MTRGPPRQSRANNGAVDPRLAAAVNAQMSRPKTMPPVMMAVDLCNQVRGAPIDFGRVRDEMLKYIEDHPDKILDVNEAHAMECVELVAKMQADARAIWTTMEAARKSPPETDDDDDD